MPENDSAEQNELNLKLQFVIEVSLRCPAEQSVAMVHALFRKAASEGRLGNYSGARSFLGVCFKNAGLKVVVYKKQD